MRMNIVTVVCIFIGKYSLVRVGLRYIFNPLQLGVDCRLVIWYKITSFPTVTAVF